MKWLESIIKMTRITKYWWHNSSHIRSPFGKQWSSQHNHSQGSPWWYIIRNLTGSLVVEFTVPSGCSFLLETFTSGAVHWTSKSVPDPLLCTWEIELERVFFLFRALYSTRNLALKAKTPTFHPVTKNRLLVQKKAPWLNKYKDTWQLTWRAKLSGLWAGRRFWGDFVWGPIQKWGENGRRPPFQLATQRKHVFFLIRHQKLKFQMVI